MEYVVKWFILLVSIRQHNKRVPQWNDAEPTEADTNLSTPREWQA